MKQTASSYVATAKCAQWREVWNSAYKRAKDKGMSDKEAESSAFAQANGVTNKMEEAGMESRKFVPFQKADEATHTVFGLVTSEATDRDGERCHYETSKAFYQK
jgi:hypothetical protein